MVLNVAVTDTTALSFLTVYPAGEALPLAANLNWVAGETVSNRVIAKLGSGGRVTLYNNSGSADIIADVNGWFSDGSSSEATGAYNALVPARIHDTRKVGGVVDAGTSIEVQVAGRGGVPASGASAVILNVAVTGPAGPGYLTVFPRACTTPPLVADLNYAKGETRSNLVVVKLGEGGKVCVYTSSSTHVVIDVAGWFTQ